MSYNPQGDRPMMSGMAAHDRKPPHHKRTLRPWQVRAVACLIGTIALALAVYAAAASYESVSHLAASRDVPLPWLNPIGIDGGLAAVILFSIALIWIRRPIGWLRFTARLFAAGTIAANLAAGWPDPVSMGLRAAAPVLFVVLVEATYTLLVHRDDEHDGRIPRARWILAPLPTFRMWRRMKLWEIRSYPQALDMELCRRQAIMKLAALYEGGWREAAPGDLVWMLTEGVKMDEALTRVAELTKPPEPAAPAGSGGGNAKRQRGGAATRKRARQPGGSTGRQSTPAAAGGSGPTTADLSTELRAMNILEEEPAISGSELGRRLGVTPGRGRQLRRDLSAAAPVPDAGSPGTAR